MFLWRICQYEPSKGIFLRKVCVCVFYGEKMIPKKNEVLARARELYAEDCYRNGCPELANVNPEPSELAESGFVTVARSELMRNSESKNAEWLKASEDLEAKELAEVFDLNETLASGVYISGTSGHGKSDLAMYLSDLLKEHGVIVIVIDSSQDWQDRSAISHVQTVFNPNQISIPEQSLIMDISLLGIGERQTFAENLCKELYEYQAKTPKHLRKEFFVVFEESHVYLTEWMLRSKKAQNIVRLLTEGRNYGIRFMCITQFASLISKVAIKFMRLRFFGYADEPNDLKFISGFLGSEHVKRLRSLEHGSFIHYASGRLSLVNIEPYDNNTFKTRIEVPKLTVLPIPEPIQSNQSVGIALAKFVMLAFFGILFLKVIL